jgi:hypothetical protein
MHLDITGLIPIAVGIYVLLAVFRVIRLSKNTETNELWLRKFGPMMKVICPLIIVLGLVELLGFFR